MYPRSGRSLQEPGIGVGYPCAGVLGEQVGQVRQVCADRGGERVVGGAPDGVVQPGPSVAQAGVADQGELGTREPPITLRCIGWRPRRALG